MATTVPIESAMRIHFEFHPGKATQMVAHLVRSLGGSTEKVKLMKLVYLAERNCFLKHGAPVAGDRLVAMQYGPVPSATLNLVNGDDWVALDEGPSFFSIQDNRVSLTADPGRGLLNNEEIEILDQVLKEHGSKHAWSLVGETHDYPEYKERYVQGTSTPIPFETILKFYGGDSGFRKGRAVISSDIAKSMHCPFMASETDL